MHQRWEIKAPCLYSSRGDSYIALNFSVCWSKQHTHIFLVYAALHIGFLATLYQAIVYSAEIFTCGEITTKASRTDASLRTGRFYTLNDSFAFGIYLCIIYMIFTRLNSLQALKSNKYDANPMLRSSGISISTQFTQVEGRILPTPSVNTSSDKILTPPPSLQFVLHCLHPPSYRLHLCCYLTAVEIRQWAGLVTSKRKVELQQ